MTTLTTSIIPLQSSSISSMTSRYRKCSPAQIRTGVKGSKGLYAWPLHSAEILFLYRASTGIFCMSYYLYNLTQGASETKLFFPLDHPSYQECVWLYFFVFGHSSCR